MLDSRLLYDRFRGALIGAAIGDAIGARALRAASAAALPACSAGSELSYTGATELTIAVAKSIIARQGFSGPHQASTLVEHYRSAPHRGYSLQLSDVLEAIDRSVPWNQAGYRLFRGSGSFNCEPASRVTPVALFAFRQSKKLRRIARDVALVTHHNGLAVEGAVLQAAAVGILLEHDGRIPINRHELLSNLRQLRASLSLSSDLSTCRIC